MPDTAPTENLKAIAAQADLHHQYLLGLELMVATREGPATGCSACAGASTRRNFSPVSASWAWMT
ncbi:MAG: hypothetical protein ACI93G_000113, partial [Hyphomonas sp.]